MPKIRVNATNQQGLVYLSKVKSVWGQVKNFRCMQKSRKKVEKEEKQAVWLKILGKLNVEDLSRFSYTNNC